MKKYVLFCFISIAYISVFIYSASRYEVFAADDPVISSPPDELFDLYIDFNERSKNPPAPNIGQQTPSGSAIRNSMDPQQEVQNGRMNALLGSRSSWSGQLNLTYSGSSISHPFAAEAPNPGNQVPPPLVTLSGAVSARYRFSPSTTLGLGTGILTQTPFQGPKNTTIADPYVDIAHSYKLGPFQSRADFQAILWTNNQYRETLGYRFGVSALNESFYQFKFGLTLGLLIQVDYNFFDAGNQYNLSQQTQYDIYTDPYVEYRISQTFNLRSVLGIASLNNRNLSGPFEYYHPNVYQTFGVGISFGKAAFVYPYIQFFPFSGNVSSETVLLGFNTIINLF